MEPQPPKRQADQAGHDSAEPSKRKTIESAVEKFLKNKKADGIDQGTYYHSGFGHAQAVPRVGQSKSLVSLDEITLEDLEDFHQPFSTRNRTAHWTHEQMFSDTDLRVYK